MQVLAGLDAARVDAGAGLQRAAHGQQAGHAQLAMHDDAAREHQGIGLQVIDLQHGIGGAELVHEPARVLDAAIAHQGVEHALVVVAVMAVAHEPAKARRARAFGAQKVLGEFHVHRQLLGHSGCAMRRRSLKGVQARAMRAWAGSSWHAFACGFAAGAVREAGGWASGFPHGGGKQGREAAQADEGRGHAVHALRPLRAQGGATGRGVAEKACRGHGQGDEEPRLCREAICARGHGAVYRTGLRCFG